MAATWTRRLGDGQATIGAVHGVHRQQVGIAGERDAAEAGAPGLVGAPGGTVGAQGAGTAGASRLAGGTGVEVSQGHGEDWLAI